MCSFLKFLVQQTHVIMTFSYNTVLILMYALACYVMQVHVLSISPLSLLSLSIGDLSMRSSDLLSDLEVPVGCVSGVSVCSFLDTMYIFGIVLHFFIFSCQYKLEYEIPY